MFIAKVYFETNTKERFKKGQEVPAEIAAKYPIRVEEIQKSKEIKVETVKTVEEVVEPKEELLIETPVEVEAVVEEPVVVETAKKKGKKRK